jgi:hypothetical protein
MAAALAAAINAETVHATRLEELDAIDTPPHAAM